MRVSISLRTDPLCTRTCPRRLAVQKTDASSAKQTRRRCATNCNASTRTLVSSRSRDALTGLYEYLGVRKYAHQARLGYGPCFKDCSTKRGSGSASRTPATRIRSETNGSSSTVVAVRRIQPRSARAHARVPQHHAVNMQCNFSAPPDTMWPQHALHGTSRTSLP